MKTFVLFTLLLSVLSGCCTGVAADDDSKLKKKLKVFGDFVGVFGVAGDIFQMLVSHEEDSNKEVLAAIADLKATVIETAKTANLVDCMTAAKSRHYRFTQGNLTETQRSDLIVLITQTDTNAVDCLVRFHDVFTGRDSLLQEDSLLHVYAESELDKVPLVWEKFMIMQASTYALARWATVEAHKDGGEDPSSVLTGLENNYRKNLKEQYEIAKQFIGCEAVQVAGVFTNCTNGDGNIYETPEERAHEPLRFTAYHRLSASENYEVNPITGPDSFRDQCDDEQVLVEVPATHAPDSDTLFWCVYVPIAKLFAQYSSCTCGDVTDKCWGPVVAASHCQVFAIVAPDGEVTSNNVLKNAQFYMDPKYVDGKLTGGQSFNRFDIHIHGKSQLEIDTPPTSKSASIGISVVTLVSVVVFTARVL